MACITKPISKNPLSISNMCLISLPSSTFTSNKISFQNSKLSFSISLSSPLTLKRKTHFSKLVVHVSDWAQGEDNTATVAEPEADAEEEAVFSWGGGDSAVVEEETETETETYTEPPEEAKLFVGNLPYDVDSEKLAQLFGQAGVVEIAEVIYNRENDQSRGFGFVTMSTVEQAEKAVEMLHQYDVNGRFLTVNKASPRGARPERTPRVFEPSYRLYVGNLPWDVDDSRLEQLFSEHGKVVNARVVYDRETGRSRGFGFITMESESELNDAISNLDGQDFGGRAIRVNVAEERPRRTF